MTMQKQDYERVAEALRAAHTHLVGLAQATAQPQTVECRRLVDFITQMTRRTAVNLAVAFSKVNPRFRVNEFLADALGEEEAATALTELEKRNTTK